MGPSNNKKKRSGGAAGATAATNTANGDPNAIGRVRLLLPDQWRQQVATLDPFASDPFLILDADSAVFRTDDGSSGTVESIAIKARHCPSCLQPAKNFCGRCRTVAYCSKECQVKHWKLSHKKACKSTPLYDWPSLPKIHSLFRGLTNEARTEPYEFITVKPTQKLDNMQEMCDQVLEGADDIFDIPGFGNNQIQVMWVMNTCSSAKDSTVAALCHRFGWTSGRYSVELVEGYRAAEELFMYCLLCDDCFQNPNQAPNLEKSYYGRALFPLQPEQFCRGNIVLYKIALKNKRRKPPARGVGPSVFLALSDDSDLVFEYELYPMTKAEVAYMLAERMRSKESGVLTRRLLRNELRVVEKPEEVQLV